MVGDRKVRFPAYDKLSNAGKNVLEEAIEKDWTVKQTQCELAARTDDTIANGSLGRWMAWRREQIAKEKWANHQAQAIVSAIKANDLMAADVGHALAMSGLLEQIGSLQNVPPEKLLRITMGFTELQQKARALDQKDQELARLQQQLELQQRKTEALAARAKAIREKAAEAQKAVSKSKDLTSEQKRKIKDLYGLLDEVAA